jgi:hypothetical protein
MQAHLTLKSSNVKTGPIPVSTTTADSCPSACPLSGNNGCYAESGPLALHWRQITEGKRGADWQAFCGQIAALPDGQLWRHNQAGDLPGDKHTINYALLGQLLEANRGKQGFTYTHYDPRIADNAICIEECNRQGFTVNLSANDLDHADSLAALDIGPVVTLLASDQLTNCATPQGRKVVVCPAVTHDNVSCATCKLCANAERQVIIGFPAHGSSEKKANVIAIKAI